MPDLFGRTFTRRDLAAHAGSLSAFGGRAARHAGRRGRARHPDAGVPHRLRPALHASRVDRAMDIVEVEHKGRSHRLALADRASPSRPARVRRASRAWPSRAPSPGCLVTCGLDHILGARGGSGGQLRLPRQGDGAPCRCTAASATIPARLTGYGERWEGDRCVLWAEGVVRQSAVFGENLHLHRRIEADLGGDEIRVCDRVVNDGFLRTPHMFFYHVNLGHPLLEEGARYLAPVRDVVWAAHAAALPRPGRRLPDDAPAPTQDFREQVWQHEMAADAAGEVPVALVNDRLGLGFEVVTAQGPAPLRLPVAELPGGQLRAGHRALDAPCPGRQRGAGARRDDLARSTRRAATMRRASGCSTGPRPSRRPRRGSAAVAAAARRRLSRAERALRRPLGPATRGPRGQHSASMERAERPADYSLIGASTERAVETGLASAEWYHTEVPRKTMKELMQRSDGPAMRDTVLWFAHPDRVGGGAASDSGGTWWCVPFFAVYGVLYGSASDSRWHECGHGTAFKTRLDERRGLPDRLVHADAQPGELALEPCPAPHRHDHRRARCRDRRDAAAGPAQGAG